MILSQVVAFKNHIEDMTPLDTALIAHGKLAPILHSIKTSDVQFPFLTEQIDNNYRKVLDQLSEFEQTVESIKTHIEQQIVHLEPAYYEESYRLYSKEMIHETADYILNRSLPVDLNTKEIILARIQRYSDWHHAGLIIRPGHEDWISHLVGCDPLYLVDQTVELLEPAVLRFNDQYQRRLRKYTINESLGEAMLSQIPNGQIGFCLIYNFLNYKPIELIGAYLAEIYKKLKPGGTVAFTFNDCDRHGAVELTERHFMCYTPGRAVIKHAHNLGFEIHQTLKVNEATTWLELRRPGQLASIRGGQSLAKIVYKSAEMLYTSEEIEKFRQEAVDLNIVHPSRVADVPIDQLLHEIKQRTHK